MTPSLSPSWGLRYTDGVYQLTTDCYPVDEDPFRSLETKDISNDQLEKLFALLASQPLEVVHPVSSEKLFSDKVVNAAIEELGL